MTKKAGKEIAVTENQAITQSTQSVEGMITLAIEKGTPVDTMERLLAMRRELKEEFAKEEYDRALAAFQADCPVIEKTKEAKQDGRILYKYAPLDSVISQVKELLAKHGFSYSFRTQNTADRVVVTCILKHKAGYAEESTMETAPANKTGIMSFPQQTASTVTFNKRYAFLNVTGIMTGDEDTDAAPLPEAKVKTTVKPMAKQSETPSTTTAVPKTPPTPINEQQLCEIADLITLLGISEEQAVIWMGRSLQKEVVINKLTSKEAEAIIAGLKAKLPKKEPALKGEVVVNIVDPSRTEKPEPEPEKPVESFSTRAMKCETIEEAEAIIGEMTLSKESHARMTAIRGILSGKGFTV